MATFDSLFEEEKPDKPSPAATPVRTGGQSFDSYFADENTAPTEGLNTVENKRPGAVREAIQMTVPMLATGGMGNLTRFRGALAQYGGDALAGAGSEAALQALGISEDSPGMIAFSGAAGPSGRLLGAVGTGVPKYVPGYRDSARAGLTGHVRALPGQIIPHGDPKAAYDAIRGNMNTNLPDWPELSATVAKHITQSNHVNLPALKKMMSTGPLENLMQNIDQALQGTATQTIKEPVKAKGVAFGKPTGLKPQTITVPAAAPGMTFENARANIEAMSQLIRDGKGTPEAGVLKDLKRAMLTDLENMHMPPGTPVAEWNKARAAYRDQKTSMALSDVIESHIVNRDGVEMVNPDGILKALRTNDELKERLTSRQMTSLTNTLKDWASASGGTKSKLASMLAGMTLAGGPAGALAGWGAAEISAKALMSEGARKTIGNIIANPTIHNVKRGTAIIAATLKGAFDEPGTTPMPGETEIVPGKVMGTLPKETRTEPKPTESYPTPSMPSLTKDDIKAKVTKTAQDVKLDPKLFHAIVKNESNYNPQATSEIGALGLTQLMPKTAKGLGLDDPRDVDQNLTGGATYFKSLLDMFKGDKAKAIQAYHMGPTAVKQGKKPGPKTQAYVSKVLLDAGE